MNNAFIQPFLLLINIEFKTLGAVSKPYKDSKWHCFNVHTSVKFYGLVNLTLSQQQQPNAQPLLSSTHTQLTSAGRSCLILRG